MYIHTDLSINEGYLDKEDLKNGGIQDTSLHILADLALETTFLLLSKQYRLVILFETIRCL